MASLNVAFHGIELSSYFSPNTSKVKNTTLLEKQHWARGEYQTEVLNLIPKQTENRLGTLEVLFIYAHSVTYIGYRNL